MWTTADMSSDPEEVRSGHVRPAQLKLAQACSGLLMVPICSGLHSHKLRIA
jgi:hypothetical protein